MPDYVRLCCRFYKCATAIFADSNSESTAKVFTIIETGLVPYRYQSGFGTAFHKRDALADLQR